MKSRDRTIIVFILQGEVDDDSFLISMLLGIYVEKKSKTTLKLITISDNFIKEDNLVHKQ